MYTCSPL